MDFTQCIYGQQSDHDHMENDELVLYVYNPDAISPKYVLLYDFKETWALIFLIKHTTIFMDT